MDPFLLSDEKLNPVSDRPFQIYSPKGVLVEMPFLVDNPVRSTDMTITGTVNPDDNSLFLKLQISDKDGMVLIFIFPLVK